MKQTALLQHIMRGGVVATLPGDLPLANSTAVADALLASPVLTAVVQPHDGTAQVIADLRQRAGSNMLVGAGDVETAVQLDAALDAGAQFIMASRLNFELLAHCMARKIIYIPTVISIMAANSAYQAGAKMVVMRTGGPQGAEFVQTLLKALPTLHVAVANDYTPTEVTQYAQAGAAALITDTIYGGSEQPMADLITRARTLQRAWDSGTRQRLRSGLFARLNAQSPPQN